MERLREAQIALMTPHWDRVGGEAPFPSHTTGSTKPPAPYFLLYLPNLQCAG